MRTFRDPSRHSSAIPQAPGDFGPAPALSALLALQRQAGNAAVARALTARVGQAPLTVQRDAAGDIADGNTTLATASQYAGQVFTKLGTYRNVMGQLSHPANDYSDAGARMASGYRAWADNYYNKTQAYLYEAQKVSEFTNVSGNLGGGVLGNRIAYLGVDTDEHPDVQYTEDVYTKDAHGTPRHASSKNSAVEIKASTSPNYASIDGLVAGGIAQLRKREVADPHRELHLELHLDNQHAAWPFTDNMVTTTYGGDISNAPKAAFDARLVTRAVAMKATKHIGVPLHVRAFFQGSPTPYAEAVV